MRENGEWLMNYCRDKNIDISNARIWRSPYLRTRQTCEEFNKYLNISDIREDITLTEQQFGLFDSVPEEIDIIDLCINPVKGLELIKKCRKSFKCIVIQPGAESEELLSYLNEKNLPYIQGCLLVGLRLYANV